MSRPIRDDSFFKALNRASGPREARLAQLQSLIEQKADVNTQFDFHQYSLTPLGIAAEQNDVEVAKLLLEYKADINLQDAKGRTPLIISVSSHDPDLQPEENVLAYLAQNKADVTIKAKRGYDALFLAALERQSETISILVTDLGADVGQVAENGVSPALISAHMDDPQSLEILVSLGACLNVANHRGKAAIHKAIWGDNEECLKILLKAGVDTSLTDDGGDCALALSSFYNIPGAADALIQHAATDLNQRDSMGRTPLMIAAMRGNLTPLVALIDKGADLDLQSNLGYTALSYAVQGHHCKVAKALLEGKAKSCIPDNWGMYPLHHAIVGRATYAPHLPPVCVTILLEHKAKPCVRDKYHTSALTLAEINNDKESAEAIEEAMKQVMLQSCKKKCRFAAFFKKKWLKACNRKRLCSGQK